MVLRGSRIELQQLDELLLLILLKFALGMCPTPVRMYYLLEECDTVCQATLGIFESGTELYLKGRAWRSGGNL